MYNQEAVKFSAHCINLRNAVETLRADGFASEELDNAAKDLLVMAREMSGIDDNIISDDENSFALGICETGNMKIGLDISKNFGLHISAETESDRQSAKKLMFSLMAKIAQNPGNYWRCVSVQDGALSFGHLSSVISFDSTRFGGRVYSDTPDINKLLDEIQRQLEKNVVDSNAEDVFDYIEREKASLPIITLAIFDLSRAPEMTVKSLQSLCNKMKGGLNVIVVDRDESLAEVLPFSLKVNFKNGQFSFRDGCTLVPATQVHHATNSDDLSALKQKKEIDSRFEATFGNELVPFTMKSTNHIEIPFALLENGSVCSFKIGGDCSTHALISGMTGYGKSVTLHTIIDLTTLYYRPDDVEIWTIDYKAVEFKCYVNKRTPHIRVIGQDNSMDFSIGLMKLLVKEFNRRKRLFTDASVKNLKEYREKFGENSITRLLIIIDEFHNLIQAVQNYPSSEYKTQLDNLLKEARAMGMSFIFCSQTVASGLTGMPQSGKDQIGIRICMKQNNSSEITETLMVKLVDTDIIQSAMNFDKGFAYYRDGESGALNLKKVKVLYVSDEMRERIIDCVNARCSESDWSREEIIYKDSNRYSITEKRSHALNLLLESENCTVADPEETNVYPAAPVSFDNEFAIKLSRNSSNNILISGNDDDMRESLVFHSICSILANPCNCVRVNIADPESSKGASLLRCLKQLNSKRLTYNLGVQDVLKEIDNYSALKADSKASTFLVWFQLNKLRTAMAIEASQAGTHSAPQQLSGDILSALDDAISMVKASKVTINEPQQKQGEAKVRTFDSVSEQLKLLFEYGPEQGLFNLVIYQAPKNFEKDKFLKVTDFDYRIATQMSADDSYRMFGKESFVSCTNESTAVCYGGNKTPIPIRPYLMPDPAWIDRVNIKLKRSDDSLC